MHFKSLKTKLMLLLIFIIVISNIILGLIAYFMSKSSLEVAVEQTITTISEKISSQVAQANEQEFHMLESLASMSMIQNPDISIEEKNQILMGAKKTNPNYENIAFYDLKGNGITSEGKKINFADRELSCEIELPGREAEIRELLSGKVYSGKKLTLTFAPYETMVFSCR